MRNFTYLVPRSLNEAIFMHESRRGRAKYIAGGTDVLVKIKEGKLAPDSLISLRHIIGQDRPFLNAETGELYIGAFMTHRSIERSPCWTTNQTSPTKPQPNGRWRVAENQAKSARLFRL